MTEEIPSIHPFGTDKLGRDIFRRVVHGGWNSLRVGIVAVGISLLFGGVIGLLTGFYETITMTTMERIVLYGITGFYWVCCLPGLRTSSSNWLFLLAWAF